MFQLTHVADAVLEHPALNRVNQTDLVLHHAGDVSLLEHVWELAVEQHCLEIGWCK
jgi:hypothetical protein